MTIYSKKGSLMIIRYDKFLDSNDSTTLMETEEYFNHIDGIQTHFDVMEFEGKSAQEINEGFSDILGALGGGFKQTLYQYAAGWILGKLGLPKEGWPMELAIQIITKVDFTNITAYFGKGSCGPWAKAIQDGLVFFITHKAGDLLVGGLKIAPGDPSQRSGTSNTIINVLTNTIGESIKNTDFVTKIEASIEGKICGEGAPGFSDIFKGKTASPGTKEELKDQLHQASKEDPAIMGQAKGLGILQYLGFGG